MITREQAENMAKAHAQGLHDDLPREECPECEGRDLSSYPRSRRSGTQSDEAITRARAEAERLDPPESLENPDNYRGPDGVLGNDFDQIDKGW